MARNDCAAIALAAGAAGGGLLLWYLLRAHNSGEPIATPSPTTNEVSTTAATSASPTGAMSPAPSPTTTAPAPSAPPSTSPTAPAPARTPGACQLRLDTNGLTSGGAPLATAAAIDLCKTAGKADLIYAHDAPAASLSDVYRALTAAGVAVVVWAP